MPPFQLELAGIYPAETDEQHQEQQDRLYFAAECLKKRSCRVQCGYIHVDKVCPCACHHTYDQHPVLDEFH